MNYAQEYSHLQRMVEKEIGQAIKYLRNIVNNPKDTQTIDSAKKYLIEFDELVEQRNASITK